MEEKVSTPVCYRHPDRPTRLACTQCERPICVECSHDAAVGQRCPDHAGSPGRHRVIDARRTTATRPGLDGAPFVRWTMLITVGIYIVSRLSDVATDRVASDLTIQLYENLWQDNRAVDAGEIWRLVTSALLHSRGSLFHVAGNMFALYIFGPDLERRVGSLPTAGLYVASAAAGGLAAFLLGPPDMVAVGASGAIFGLLGAWLYASWLTRGSVPGRGQFRSWGVLAFLMLVIPLSEPQVSWEAHLGGLIGGVLIAWGWRRFAVGSGNPNQRRTMVAAGVLLIALGLALLL